MSASDSMDEEGKCTPPCSITLEKSYVCPFIYTPNNRTCIFIALLFVAYIDLNVVHATECGVDFQTSKGRQPLEGTLVQLFLLTPKITFPDKCLHLGQSLQ